MDEKIFDRVEKKYLISRQEQKEVYKVLKKEMEKDKYFKSEVFNLYFDTDNFDFIIKSIERPHFKEKLRARSYGGYDKVFLEIKTKLKGKEYNVGYKRRVLITHGDFEKLIKRENSLEELAKLKVETPDDLQIAKEVDYLINRFNLKPKILVYYERESYLGKNGLRITFDENLKYRDTDLSFKTSSRDQNYFQNDRNIIMEIKAQGAMPLWLVHLLSKQKIYPSQFSKIGKIYQTIRKEQNV